MKKLFALVLALIMVLSLASVSLADTIVAATNVAFPPYEYFEDGVEAGDSETYLNIWKQFIQLWNELLPEVPLYSNIYVTVYPDWLENYNQTSYWSFQNAIVYANIAQ